MSSSSRTCVECAPSNAECIATQQQAGYSQSCQRGPLVAVYCKSTSAQGKRDLGVPLSGVFLLASLWATTRLGRRGA